MQKKVNFRKTAEILNCTFPQILHMLKCMFFQNMVTFRMHCMYCGMPKGTSQAEAASKNEKIEPIILAIVKLCLSEGISYSISQSVKNSIK